MRRMVTQRCVVITAPLLSSFWIMLRCRCFEQQRVGGECYCCLSCILVTVGCKGEGRWESESGLLSVRLQNTVWPVKRRNALTPEQFHWTPRLYNYSSRETWSFRDGISDSVSEHRYIGGLRLSCNWILRRRIIWSLWWCFRFWTVCVAFLILH